MSLNVVLGSLGFCVCELPQVRVFGNVKLKYPTSALSTDVTNIPGFRYRKWRGV